VNLNTGVVTQTPEWAISQSQSTTHKLQKESPILNNFELNQQSVNSLNKNNNLILKTNNSIN